MEKEYIIVIAIILGSIIISVASYLGSSFEYRSKLNVCEEIMREKLILNLQNLKKLLSSAKYKLT